MEHVPGVSIRSAPLEIHRKPSDPADKGGEAWQLGKLACISRIAP